MRRSRCVKKGNNFLAVGIGRSGPYLSYSRRVSGRGYVKASVGTKGAIIGAKYVGRSMKTSVSHNLTTGISGFSIRPRRVKRRR
jgi:hypothetical protein